MGRRSVPRTAEHIVERIMTAHRDMEECDCWVCEHGRKLGLQTDDKWVLFRAIETYPVPHRRFFRNANVRIREDDR